MVNGELVGSWATVSYLKIEVGLTFIHLGCAYARF